MVQNVSIVTTKELIYITKIPYFQCYVIVIEVLTDKVNVKCLHIKDIFLEYAEITIWVIVIQAFIIRHSNVF